jgi:pyruvate,water dikinase
MRGAMNIKWFKDLNIKDIPLVGGKNASLGEMFSKLTKNGIKVPNGFALTSTAYWEFLKYNKIDKKIKQIVNDLNVHDVKKLAIAGKKVREIIMGAEFPKEMEQEIKKAYAQLSKEAGRKNVDVAVRSSATAEDLPDASFAGQQETYLNVCGDKEIMEATKKCIASLFTDRAISYREDKGFDHMAIALSVCVQQMVRSDLSNSGVMFTCDTESGFNGVVLINASYGLGEYVVKGRVVPDQYYVFKKGLENNFKSIISRRLGSKEVKLIYGKTGTIQTLVNKPDQKKYCLTDEEVLKLAKWGIQIEKHYGHAMDIEWAKDGQTGELFIVQARGETVKSQKQVNVIETYKLQKVGKLILTGMSIGQKIGQGKVRIIESPKQLSNFKAGEVLVTRITDPDWEPIMRIAGAIVTEQGGKTSHAAIVSRELGVPCLVGAKNARKVLKNGVEVTVSCAEGEEGKIYKGRLPFMVEKTEIKKVEPTRTKIMMNVGDPDNAFAISAIPNDGVGLAREEFIFSNFIKAHPLALINYNKLKDKKAKAKIKELTADYPDKKQYCVEKLAEGIAFIATAFYPNDVIVRLSDFKTNEYSTLIGGKAYEPKEENPMLGWRGASRYYDPKYKPGFKLECEALKKVREEWGLKNVIIMVPFCRTVEEGKKVLAVMKEFGLERGKNGLQVYVMCEIPSNVILAKEYCEIFDGFSIGSNDLTQLTLGVDRDSALVSHVYDEKNLAVKTLIRDVIQTAHKYGKKVGICGQAPSDYPEFAEFLVQEGIDSISLNPDTVLSTRKRIAEMEKKVASKKNPKFKSLALAGKLLFLIGAVGLATALGGYGCQTVNNQAVEEKMQQTLQNSLSFEVAKLKGQLRQDIAKDLESQLPKTSYYSEDSFVKLTMLYPMNWGVEHGSDYIKFKSTDKNSWFSILKQKQTYGAVPDKDITQSTWMNYKTKKFKVRDSNAVESMILEVYPNGYDKTGVIEIVGDTKNFEMNLKNISVFEVK